MSAINPPRLVRNFLDQRPLECRLGHSRSDPKESLGHADTRAPQHPTQQPLPLQGTTQQPVLLQGAPYIRPHRTDVGRPSTRETLPAAATGRFIYHTGDFNAPHPSWGYPTIKPSGNNLSRGIDDLSLTLVTDHRFLIRLATTEDDRIATTDHRPGDADIHPEEAAVGPRLFQAKALFGDTVRQCKKEVLANLKVVPPHLLSKVVRTACDLYNECKQISQDSELEPVIDCCVSGIRNKSGPFYTKLKLPDAFQQAAINSLRPGLVLCVQKHFLVKQCECARRNLSRTQEPFHLRKYVRFWPLLAPRTTTAKLTPMSTTWNRLHQLLCGLTCRLNTDTRRKEYCYAYGRWFSVVALTDLPSMMLLRLHEELFSLLDGPKLPDATWKICSA
ncbi:uncharacterized protein [Dermacentor albipictus]|uniref:uncharacterized protein n=1 Tax=Dermacentor albipictus TaxID=60249 RepID=UPI0038FC57B9